jgi:hypothetical protein
MSLGVASGFRHATVPPQDSPKIPLAAVAGPPRIFFGISHQPEQLHGGHPLHCLTALSLHHLVRRRYDLVPRNRKSLLTPHSREAFLRVFAGRMNGSWQVGARSCPNIGCWYLAQRGSRERGPRGIRNVSTISTDGHPYLNRRSHWL